MLRIKIELVPHGIEEMTRTLGVIEIANEGRVARDIYCYKIRAWDRDDQEPMTTAVAHNRPDGWAVLLRAALNRILEQCASYGLPLK